MTFVIEYDRATGTIELLRSFDDRRQADDLRLKLGIRASADGLDREIVALDAESEAALRVTHRRYFENRKVLAETES